MSTVDNNQLTEEQVRALVDRAAVLLRLRPVPGSDPEQARMWLKSVAEFLSSEALRQVLQGLGVQPPTGPLASPSVDWEVELVVVIGRRSINVDEAEAWQHAAGLTSGPARWCPASTCRAGSCSGSAVMRYASGD